MTGNLLHTLSLSKTNVWKSRVTFSLTNKYSVTKMYGSHQFSIPTRMPQFNHQQNLEGRISDGRRLPFHHHSRGEEHWCETCDRGFPTIKLLEKHKQQHQKCNIDGCQFIAHPNVVTKHIQMQHASGLYKKIAKLNNPEEIKKWREERKNKYPTRKNIEKKEAEKQEKIDRGEKIGLKSERFEKKNKKGGNQKRKSGFKRDNHQHKRYKSQTTSNCGAVENKQSEEQNIFNTNKNQLTKHKQYVPVTNTSFKLKPFAGIRNIILEESTEDETEQNIHNLDILTDDEEHCKLIEDVGTDKQALTHPKVCGALSSLICNYESSEEESTETGNKKIQKVTSDNVTASNSQESEQSKDNDSGPEEVKIVKEKDIISVHTNNDMQNSSKIKNVHTGRPIKKSNFNRPKPKIPSTLLRKLLNTEIQHERNIVLQCIRHIVKNNFFDK